MGVRARFIEMEFIQTRGMHSPSAGRYPLCAARLDLKLRDRYRVQNAVAISSHFHAEWARLSSGFMRWVRELEEELYTPS